MKGIKPLAKLMLPEVLLSRFRKQKSTRLLDKEAAREFKKNFFWNAFKALEYNKIGGDYAEFGCHGGITFRLAFDQIRTRSIQRHMWAFDSFKGLPEAVTSIDNHPHWKKGKMATDVEGFQNLCAAHGISRDRYTIVQGFYENTLAKLAKDDPPADIALAYIDCDMYSSTKTVLEFLSPRLKNGMIIAFDDYFCWSSEHASGERTALVEILPELERTWNLVPYRSYGWAGESFVVETAKLPA